VSNIGEINGKISEDPKQDSDLLSPQSPEDEEILASFFTTVPRLLPMSLNQDHVAPPEETVYDRQQFWIRLANTTERREKAALLVDRMYARKGYLHEGIIRTTPHTITLIVSNRDGDVIGTVTIGMDSNEEGLLAEENYRDEVNALRAQGKKICEFNGLAVDSGVKSKLVIARLFHMALLYPWGVFGYTDGIVEVSPAHAGFYQRLLGFERVGAERVCPRVNAVGVLLHIDFAIVDERISRVGGLMEKAVGDSSLFPYGFTKTDADGIVGRLKRGE